MPDVRMRTTGRPTLAPADRRRRVVELSVVVAATCLAPLLLDAGELLPCVFRNLTGLPCPLCGGSHALFYLARFEFARAVEANAGVVMAAACVPVWVILRAWEAIGGRTALKNRITRPLYHSAPALALSMVVIPWILRLSSAD